MDHLSLTWGRVGTNDRGSREAFRAARRRRNWPADWEASWVGRAVNNTFSSHTQTPTHRCPFQASISPEGQREGAQARASAWRGWWDHHAESKPWAPPKGSRDQRGDEQLMVVNTDVPHQNHMHAYTTPSTWSSDYRKSWESGKLWLKSWLCLLLAVRSYVSVSEPQFSHL